VGRLQTVVLEYTGIVDADMCVGIVALSGHPNPTKRILMHRVMQGIERRHRQPLRQVAPLLITDIAGDETNGEVLLTGLLRCESCGHPLMVRSFERKWRALGESNPSCKIENTQNY
jgi:hypothetical protein